MSATSAYGAVYMQNTLRNSIGCVGVGLHTGAKVALTLKPAPPDTGILFKRYDRPGCQPIPARYDLVHDTSMCTAIGDDRNSVSTIEHLMAAFACCEIDNALVEISGPEVPIMDGSAQPFVFLIECAGIVQQDRPRRRIEILRTVSVSSGDSIARLEPADRFSVDCEIHFDHPLIGSQSFALAFESDQFKTEIARARTFGFAGDVEDLWSRGLARGASLRNAIVVGDDRILNEEGLRFEDEFVRHKALDALGDLRLAGAPIVGCFVGYRAGHATHNMLLHALFADESAWKVIEEPGVEHGLEDAMQSRRAAHA